MHSVVVRIILALLFFLLACCRVAELDILVTDLERANQRAATAEKETEKLQHLASDRQTTTEQDKVNLVEIILDTILVKQFYFLTGVH